MTLASGTMASRASGLLRTLVLAYVLGFSPLSDAYNLANTIPNSLYDLVLGGVVSASFVSIFVQRITLDGERKAWRSISSVLTLSLIVLALASALAWIFAPQIVNAMTAFHHLDPSRPSATLALQRDVTTTFLRWFAPQIFLYGLLSLGGVLLQIRHRFGASSYAPILNNVVAIAVLWWFHVTVAAPTLEHSVHTSALMWLAAGTTAGLVVQFIALWPSLATSNLGRVRFRLALRDEAVTGVWRLGGWTLLVVVTNQVALYVTLALAFGVGGNGPVTAYTYGWAFMQMPYGVIVASVLQAITTDLVVLYTSDERHAYAERLMGAMRTSLRIVTPLAMVLVVVAQPVVALLLNRGDGSSTLEAGVVLAVLAMGLPGYTVFQIVVRGLQAQQRGRDIFGLYLFQNLFNITLALLIGRHSLGALIGTIAISYTVAAALAVGLMSVRNTPVVGLFTEGGMFRLVAVSVATAITVAVGYSLTTATSGFGLALRTGLALLCGGPVLLFAYRKELRQSGRTPLVRGKV